MTRRHQFRWRRRSPPATKRAGRVADRAGFSSVAHLSTQFKKLTGMTPTAFKEIGGGRLPLDHVG